MPPTGPPPFQPSAEHLSSLAAEISTATSRYASSPSTQGLQKVQAATEALQLAATSPTDFLFNQTFQSHVNGCIRIAVGMGIFDNLPQEPGKSVSLPDLALRCNSTEDFVLRIARTLAATHIIESPSRFEYAHSLNSRGVLSQKNVQLSSVYMTDIKVAGLARCGDYFEKFGYKSPDDPKNSPCVFAKGYQDMDFFDMLKEFPTQLTAFNASMAMTAAMGGVIEAVNTYPFDELSEEGKTVLVDVGGGKGQTLAEIKRLHPNIKGKMVLQDLKWVLEEENPVISRDEVEFVPFNFLEEENPVRGQSMSGLRDRIFNMPTLGFPIAYRLR
ncbi:MAG: hypothetical protein M1820_007528 [Bogoriella megaspora]|nr:MAG: hypothetical protein M1820_007528 [Bogoriella megaspora]